MRIIFIDGYNVLNCWPNLKCDKEESLQGAREKLINIMHNYCSYENCKVIIVYDGHKVAGNRENKDNKYNNLTVVFTKDGQTADIYIEKEVHNLGRKYDVTVVTSDRLEQETIFQRGAVRMSSLEFYREVSKVEKIINEKEIVLYKSEKNILSDNVSQEIAEILESIRRS